MNLEIPFLHKKLQNPVTTGAGTFGYGVELEDFIDVSRLGAVVVKGTSKEAWPGNAAPRICETPSGMLNAIGLQNNGLDYFIEETLPKLQRLKTPLIVGVFDKTPENYAYIATELSKHKEIFAIELNLSCPNIEQGGKTFCADPDLMREVVREVRNATKLPILAKLAPMVTSIEAIAEAALEEGADGLTLINTLVGMSIDVHTRRPRIKNNTGGLSGPAIHPITVATVWKVRRAFPDAQILGIGGVYDTNSAVELMLAGANVVGIGTANFYNPKICIEIIDGMKQFCKEQGVSDVQELVGAVKDF